VKVYYYKIKYKVRESGRKRVLICKVIRNNGFKPGDLKFIITNDEEIKKINKEFLGHDYPTDVISFRMNEGNEIEGEIYISIDSVKYNSKIYGNTVDKELLRVMIHGVLHLIGLDDNNDKNKRKMKEEEDFWITKY